MVQALAKTVKKEATEIDKLSSQELAAVWVMKILADKLLRRDLNWNHFPVVFKSLSKQPKLSAVRRESR